MVPDPWNRSTKKSNEDAPPLLMPVAHSSRVARPATSAGMGMSAACMSAGCVSSLPPPDASVA